MDLILLAGFSCHLPRLTPTFEAETRELDRGYITLFGYGDFIILHAVEPYLGITEIHGYSDSVVNLVGRIHKEFRWSNDAITYSDWVEMTDTLLQTIPVDPLTPIWMEWKYTLLDPGEVAIEWVRLNVTMQDTSLDSFNAHIPGPVAYAVTKGNTYFPTNLGRAGTWSPYSNLNPLTNLYKDLDFMINNNYGHDVTYWRVSPQERSRDTTFLEWTLYDVEDPRCIKVVIPNGEMPDTQMSYTPWGLDYAGPMEVHIDKRYFEYMFGARMMPQKRDIIFIGSSNRLYEVDSSVLERDFMNEPIYYRVMLKKYQDRANVQKSEEISHTLQSYTQGLDEIFGDEIGNERERLTNPQQFGIKSLQEDPTREYLDVSLPIGTETIDNFSTKVAQWHYSLMDLFTQYEDEYHLAVQYRNILNIPSDQDLSFTCWFSERTRKVQFKEIERIEQYESEPEMFNIHFRGQHPKVKPGQWLKISTPEDSTFAIHAEIFDVVEKTKEVRIRIEPIFLDFLNENWPGWMTGFTALTGRQAFRRIFVHAYDEAESKGVMIDSFDSYYFRVHLNGFVHYITLDNPIVKNQWYGMVVNVSNTFRQLSLHLWERSPKEERTTALQKVHTSVITNLPVQAYQHPIKYSLWTSALDITNIRILKYTLEEDKQSLFLNQYIVKDAARAYVIDNAEPKSKNPRIGSGR